MDDQAKRDLEEYIRRIDEAIDQIVERSPWWCRICGAGEGDPQSPLPPLGHVCNPTPNDFQGIVT